MVVAAATAAAVAVGSRGVKAQDEYGTEEEQ
jgi:hypothetical protein